MSTAALSTIPSFSPRVQQSDGMLACLGGFSPRIPSIAPSPRPRWASTNIDEDLMHLEHNPQLAAKIMRKRQQERDRNYNRLTPRMQRIGIDIAALGKQVEDKKVAEEVRRSEDDKYLEFMQIKSEIAAQGETLFQEEKRNRQRECVNYSIANLSRHQRREWDLSDPLQLKKDKLPRVEGSIPALSSMQRFEGEEGVSPEKLKEKRDNQVSWLMAQMAEKKLKANLDKQIDEHHDATLLAANELRVAVEIAHEQEEKEEVMKIAKANKELAMTRAAREKARKERDEAQKKEHMTNASEHNLMRERHDYSIGLNGNKRDYKRCSYKEEQQAWDMNRQLLMAKIDRKRAEEHLDDEYQMIGQTFDDLGQAYDDAWKNMNINRRKQFNADNAAMAKERRARDAKDKLEYTSFAASPR